MQETIQFQAACIKMSNDINSQYRQQEQSDVSDCDSPKGTYHKKQKQNSVTRMPFVSIFGVLFLAVLCGVIISRRGGTTTNQGVPLVYFFNDGVGHSPTKKEVVRNSKQLAPEWSVVEDEGSGDRAGVAQILARRRKELGKYLEPAGKTKPECTIFVAPSSVKGADGLGIYTIQAMASQDELLTSFDGPSIPVIDYELGFFGEDGLEKERMQWIEVFDNYWWRNGIPDHASYEGWSVIDFQVTFGSLPNHHCILDTLDFTYKSPIYDDTMLDDGDPGSGAVSYHNGRYFRVTEKLAAGSEIFLNYGHCIRDGGHPKWTDHIPMIEDYQMAVQCTRELWREYISNKTQTLEHLEECKTAINNSVVQTLIPSTTKQLEQVMADQSKTSMGYKEIADKLARFVGSTPRTPQWIQGNGLCLENLIPGKSQIPHAARGGFAQFAMCTGEIVVPAPTLQIVNKEVLQMLNKTTGVKDGTTQQLLMNYCFGHAQSSLLLCPDTNAILINHCSSRNARHCGDGPNAKIQWASEWDKVSPQWIDMTLDEIAERRDRGISMEVVALRNIEKGEEVTIDYGLEWELAWEHHVANWAAPKDMGEYMSATIANEYKDDFLQQMVASNDLRATSNETNLELHNFLFTACPYWVMEDASRDVWKTPQDNWKNMSDKDILGNFSDDYSGWVIDDYESHHDGSHWPCTVVQQQEEDEGTTYTVRIFPSPWYEEPQWAANGLPRFLTRYPKESIRFFHQPYQSDQHLQGAFRHYIGIPEDIMPAHWKNLRAKES